MSPFWMIMMLWCYVFDPTDYSASQIELFTKHINSILMWKDYVVLEDHPDAEEMVSGVKMNFGECGLMVLQRLSKLNAAANSLNEKRLLPYLVKRII
jgi:hypothetical protein